MAPVYIEIHKCSVVKKKIVSKGSVSMTFCDEKEGRGLEKKVRTQRQTPPADR